MSLTNRKRTEYVMVEWDDGSMEHTSWYIGYITEYRDHRPGKFKDIGPEAFPDEEFNFFSSLMHHYMVCIQIKY